MFSFASVFSVDPNLGKVDKSSLSQQTVMELFIEGMTNTEEICGNHSEPKEISEWGGVTLNDEKEVTQIVWGWGRRGLAGSVSLQWLPSTVQKVYISGHKLTGSAYLETLPDEMEYIDLSKNLLSGEIDLTRLPVGLEYLNVTNNQFSGSINVTNLPAHMTQLYLAKNNFTGETDFSKLPEKLKFLSVANTQLEGVIYVQEGQKFQVYNSKVKVFTRA